MPGSLIRIPAPDLKERRLWVTQHSYRQHIIISQYYDNKRPFDIFLIVSVKKNLPFNRITISDYRCLRNLDGVGAMLM